MPPTQRFPEYKNWKLYLYFVFLKRWVNTGKCKVIRKLRQTTFYRHVNALAWLGEGKKYGKLIKFSFCVTCAAQLY